MQHYSLHSMRKNLCNKDIYSWKLLHLLKLNRDTGQEFLKFLVLGNGASRGIVSMLGDIDFFKKDFT